VIGSVQLGRAVSVTHPADFAAAVSGHVLRVDLLLLAALSLGGIAIPAFSTITGPGLIFFANSLAVLRSRWPSD
jgi:hypothetical protein